MELVYDNRYHKDVISSANFLVQYLQDAGFQGTLDDGTGLYDLLIKPLSLIYVLFQKDITRAESYLSIQNAMQNKAVLGDEFDTVVDAILSNWFMTRKDGVKSTGRVKLIFSKRLKSLTIPENTQFLKGTTVFRNTNPVLFGETDFTHFIDLNKRQYYYVILDVVSTKGSDVQINQGDIFTSSMANIYLSKVEAASNFMVGSEKESNEDFIARTKQALTTRELVSNKSINNFFLEEIPSVKSIYIAGAGSSEQVRDVLSYENSGIRVGNKADIYLFGGLQKVTYKEQLKQDNVRGLLYLEMDGIFYNHIFQVYTMSGQDKVPLPNYGFEAIDNDIFNMHVVDSYVYRPRATPPVRYEYLWTPQQKIRMLFPFSEVPYIEEDTTVYVECLTSSIVQEGFTHFRNNFTRSVCFDPIIKAPFPVVLNLNLSCKINHDAFGLRSENDWSNAIKNSVIKYVSTIPATRRFSPSKCIDIVYNEVPEVVEIYWPISTTYAIGNPYKISEITDTIEGTFSDKSETGEYTQDFILPGGLLPYTISKNTMQFYTDSDLISVNLTN